jgi:rare lipoprotein A
MRLKAIFKHFPLYLLMALALAGCNPFNSETQDGAPTHFKGINDIPNPTVRPLKKSRYGNPSSYVVNGKRYFVLPTAKGYSQTGIASWYGTKFHGKLTSTREPYNVYAMTAASPILPIPCFVRVTDLKNHRSIIVKVNDRGPFEDERIIDLSYVAASKLGMLKQGTAPVKVVALTPGNIAYRKHAVASPRYLINHWKQKQADQQENIFAQPKSGLFLQVGAYSQKENAASIQQKIERLIHYPVVIQKATIQHKIIYLVKIGPLKNQKEVSTVEHALGKITL